MLACFLRRVLPFMMTLILGTGLWNVFGFKKVIRGGGGPGYNSGGGPRHYRHSCDQLVTSESSPLRILSRTERRPASDAQGKPTAGKVRLLVRFNADGTTTVIDRLSSTLPDSLTEDAVRAAWETRFIPATVDGQPIAKTTVVSYILSSSDNEIRMMEP
jgi:hypothetical protein